MLWYFIFLSFRWDWLKIHRRCDMVSSGSKPSVSIRCFHTGISNYAEDKDFWMKYKSKKASIFIPSNIFSKGEPSRESWIYILAKSNILSLCILIVFLTENSKGLLVLLPFVPAALFYFRLLSYWWSFYSSLPQRLFISLDSYALVIPEVWAIFYSESNGL